ncbi:Hpt domain-containing protein [Altererythrobacter sp. Root672]|uniref:Hpt domain-containing protein n=1 Tax=Altererythrobacter sp. Root672 TaxID=1736584 RepID=UPI00138F4BFC|nr:Hpt domain-containing protein [Altererythrobacter sp. Root672]
MDALRTRFITRARTEIAALREAHRQHDEPAMRKIAHSLAGNAGLFGWPDLSARARELEDALVQPASQDEVESRLEAVMAEMPR